MGTERLLARVVQVFGAAQAHHGYPLEFFKGWSGTLVCDGYGGYYKVMEKERRIGASCLAKARRKFDELIKDNLSPMC